VPSFNTGLSMLLAVILGAGVTVSPRLTALALVATGVVEAVRRLWRHRLRARAARANRERVLECCDLLAAELRSGRPTTAALAIAAESWPALSTVAQTHAYGGDVPVALRGLAREPGAREVAQVAAAWQVAHRTGAGLAVALDRVAIGLRADRATERVIQGELASARATARLVAALPILALVIGSGSGADPVSFLVGTTLGLACLAGGLALGLLGVAWIERIAQDVWR